jgi:hypothetical protein
VAAVGVGRSPVGRQSVASRTLESLARVFGPCGSRAFALSWLAFPSAFTGGVRRRFLPSRRLDLWRWSTLPAAFFCCLPAFLSEAGGLGLAEMCGRLVLIGRNCGCRVGSLPTWRGTHFSDITFR